MNRLGFSPDKAFVAAQRLRAAGYDLILTMHFANADEPNHPLNQTQIDALLTLKKQLDPIKASLCNSAALIQWSHLHFDWVRPGIMLYGSSPFADRSASQLALKPVMTLTTQLIAIHEVPLGAVVGYGSSYTTTRVTQLGVIAMGYGDGYPRVVSGAHVSIDGVKVPIVGRVSMDMLTVDLTDLPALPILSANVTLWGNDISADDAATAAGTISYELFTRLSMRPVRHIAD
jgi:alanine racemase